jgi:hypothetical protein
MSVKLFICLFAFLFLASATGVDWKQIIRERDFIETKSKGLLPKKVLNELGIQHYTQIAGPGEAWNCCCNKLEFLPDLRLNWAAYDTLGDWVVSYSTGGRVVSTTIKLIPDDSAVGVISHKELFFDSCFTTFRKKYLEEK